MKHTITDEQMKKVLQKLSRVRGAIMAEVHTNLKLEAVEYWRSRLGDLDEARSILNTIEKQPESGWMPIETAPRDGTLFLSWSEDYGQCVGSMSHGCFDICGQEDIEYRPTHWMPLPPPPATPAQQAEAELIEGMHRR